MDTLKKYVTGRNLQIGTLIGTAFTIMMFIMSASIGSNTEAVSSFSDLGGLISSLKTFCNIFYLDFIVILVVTSGYAFRMIHEKDFTISTKVLTILNGIICLFALICFSPIHNIKAGLSGDFASLMQLGDIEGQLNILKVMLYIQIAAGVAAGYFLFYKKKPTVSQDTQSDGEASEAKTEKEEHESIIDQIKAYYATEKGKRNIRIGGAVAGVIILLVVIVNIYESTRRVDIDLTSSCRVTFEGVSGEGTANINCSPDYDQTNGKIGSFVDSITYSIENNGSLENGMKVTLKAKYSEATAEGSKVNPIKTSKKFTVKGLDKAYREFKDIPKRVSSQFEKAAKAYLENDIQEDAGGLFGDKSITIDEITLIGIYYDYTSYNNSGTAYYVYRTKETRERTYSTNKEVNYYAVSIENIKSDHVPDLDVDSYDMDVDEITIYDDEKTDEAMIEEFMDYRSSLEVVQTHYSSEVYTDESIDKD